MLTFATLYGTRRVGRPPVRWLESKEEDLRNIGVGIWKRMAVDRDKWRIITGAVKVGTRLQNQKKNKQSMHIPTNSIKHHPHLWLCSPCKNLGRLTPEVHNLIKRLRRTPLDE
jgi:hypothetical protein